MKRKLFSILAATTIFIGAGSNVFAAQKDGTERDYIWKLPNQNEHSIIEQYNPLIDLFSPDSTQQVPPTHFMEAGAGMALWTITKTKDNGILSNDRIKWDNLSSGLVKSVTFANSMITSVIGSNLKEDGSQSTTQPESEQADSTTTENPETLEASEPEETMEAVKPAEAEATTEPSDSADTIETEEIAESTNSDNKSEEPNDTNGKEITVEATAYTADCEGCSGITKTGVDLRTENPEKVIAVDPSVIPLGSKVHVEGYGYATAADIGGGIDGNEIDVFIPEETDALEWGRKEVTVTIID